MLSGLPRSVTAIVVQIALYLFIKIPTRLRMSLVIVYVFQSWIYFDSHWILQYTTGYKEVCEVFHFRL